MGAAVGGGVWGRGVARHRVFRSGPHETSVYDAGRNALFDPARGGWLDLDTGQVHRYAPDSPLMPYMFLFLGAGCLAFLVLALNWVVGHRQLVGYTWRACLRRPLDITVLLGFWALLLAVPYLAKGDVIVAVLGDPPTAVFLGVTLGAVLGVTLLVYLPWIVVRGLPTIVLMLRLVRAKTAPSGPGAGRQDALRDVVRRAEVFRTDAGHDLDSLAGLVRAEAFIDLLTDQGSDTMLDDLLRDGPAALDAPPRHVVDRLMFALGRPAVEVNVARAFILRYEWTGAAGNLDRAIAVLDPLAAKPPRWFWLTLTDRSVVCRTLAWALKDRYELRADRADLDRALDLVRQVSGWDPARARGRLVELELIRYRATGDPAALAAAVGEGRRGEPDPGTVVALLERFDRDGDSQDLDEARELAERLVETRGPGHPLHAVCLTVRARALDASGERDAAAQCLREAVGDSSSPLQTRLAAAVGLGELGAGGPLSVEGYAAAVELLPQMAWIGLRRDDQRWLLSRWQGVSTAAAAAAIAEGRVAYAVEVLEHGRAVMWGQLARLRTGVEAAGAADPALARRLAEIRAELDMPDDGTGPDPGHRTGADVERRIRLGREWEQLAAQLSESERTGYRELAGAADHGPVVVVNASPLRCDAIVLLPDRDEPLLVPLDRLDHDELVEWARQSADPDGRHQAMLNVIAPRLWTDLAVPVLTALRPHLKADRRIWWCPTGPFTALPIHAAGQHTRPGGPALLDEVVSSYTPTIGALLRSAERAVTARGRLVVAAPQTLDRPELPEVAQEAAEFLRHFPDAVPLDPAHVADVLTRLRDARWAHFACHADAAGLAVADGVVSLDQLADLGLPGAEFCYLSACSTAAPDPRAYDEAIHLAALLHLQSYTHVVGTLWEVDSDKALDAAREVYRTLTAHGPPDSGRAAQAVHNAAQTLRQAAPHTVDVWSSLLHIGP
ncbi:CHAT domain-containing tetratricopeptide repeat protein [Streptomyces endophyticus]|uniref:CHAT domain-containing protein n=1 Tax=Streptomyces endophyticus TaxID=714166 RepID=A0ABU6F124_9ACTN|nr:CHAT domain-containing tetratricopeptide repeat protein [Streptomyces endophyticus]MEB8337183.1 CHAT domain-containing protein [Streptomyces endophyticus]